MSTDSTDLRERGEKRLEMMRNAKTKEDWNAIFTLPKPSFPFAWNETWEGCWKQCVEYRVSDLAGEMSFFVDRLGFSIYALQADYAMFTSPDQAFFLAIRPAADDAPAAAPNSIGIEFMVADINAAVAELEGRGVRFEEAAKPCMEGSPMYIAYLRTPNGIRITLWGMGEMPAEVPADGTPAEEPAV